MKLQRWTWYAAFVLLLPLLGHCSPEDGKKEPTAERLVERGPAGEAPGDGSAEKGRDTGPTEAARERSLPEPRNDRRAEAQPPERRAPEKSADGTPEQPRVEKDPTEGPSTDESPRLCKVPSDCPAPTCQGNQPCTQRSHVCQKGRCVPMQEKVQGATCDPSAGVCQPPSCISHCDCFQGFSCVAGQCKYETKAKYCCENPGCPSSQPCRNRQESGGFCTPGGTGQKTCADYLGQCTGQALPCKAGTLEYPQISCGSKLLKCCALPPPSQCQGKGGRCIKSGSSCHANEQIGKLNCTTSSELCCIPKATTNPCVQNAGVCYSLTTACKPGYAENSTFPCDNTGLKCCLPKSGPGCQSDKDCGPPTCQMTSKGCAHTLPKCSNGTCQKFPTTAPGTCDPKTGMCK